jgi:hypothetical protein
MHDSVVYVRTVNLKLILCQPLHRRRLLLKPFRTFQRKPLKLTTLTFLLFLITTPPQPAHRIVLFPINIILITAPTFAHDRLVELRFNWNVLNVLFSPLDELLCAGNGLHDLLGVELVGDEGRS